MSARLHFIQTTGAADAIGPSNGNRRFVALPVQAAPLCEFRITVPGHTPFHGLFHSAAAAQQQAEQIYPGAHPASVVCTSRLRIEARP